ncbi:hypothetical protein OAB16_00055 [Planktomarina sp.]|jgi:hypothetical protein|nr:hypothetical protein [Planktomarina sp.]|tara:strand:+ start:2776 stop:3900 length:1125 start_codon:yes stop_codon:yes gene_type:complete
MSPGTYISLTLHAALVGWLLFGGDFDRKPLEVPVTEVSVVSAELFDILVNNTPPSIDTSLEIAATQPDIEQSEPPIDPVMDIAPEKTTQVLSPNVQNDTLPESVPDKPVRLEEVIIIPPVVLAEPEVEHPKLLETSLAPKPRPALRVAPVAVAPPAPNIDIGDITRDAAAPQVVSVEVAQEQTAKSPQAAAPEIVTEAENPSEVIEISKFAPPRTVRPQKRPAPSPLAAIPDKQTTSVVAPIDPLAVALAEALGGADVVSETEGNVTEALAPQAIRGMQLAISPCWNLGASSSAVLFTTVVVGMKLSIEGKPLENSIYLVGYEGGDSESAQRAFETAQRAIKECGAQGFELPADQYSAWQNVEITFNPEKMRVR